MKCKNRAVPYDISEFDHFQFHCPLGTEVDFEMVNYGLLSTTLKKLDKEKICYTEEFQNTYKNWPASADKLEDCTKYIDDSLVDQLKANCKNESCFLDLSNLYKEDVTPPKQCVTQSEKDYDEVHFFI